MLIELAGHDKESGIYKITNGRNGRVYIGSAVNLRNRGMTHRRDLSKNRHCNSFMQADYNLDPNLFVYKILVLVSDKINLLQEEQSYLDRYFDEQVNCYNIHKMAGNSLGRKVSAETKAKQRAAGLKHWAQAHERKEALGLRMAKQKITPEMLEKLRVANVGKKMSDEVKAKISKAKTGLVNSEETRAKISASNKGKVVSEETKKKLSESQKGRKLSKEHLAKMEAFNKAKHTGNKYNLGRIVSAETRALISICGKGRKHTDATKEKCRIAGKKRKSYVGVKASSEAKKNMSIAQKARWERHRQMKTAESLTIIEENIPLNLVENVIS